MTTGRLGEIVTDDDLDDWLSHPTDGVIQSLNRLSGDLVILGAGGKMGPTLARMARRAMAADREVFAVSRFSSASAAANLERHGVRTISCDLLDRHGVSQLPDAASVVFMAGMNPL